MAVSNYFEVKQVFVHIPAELSATGFVLKISGHVRIVNKGSDNFLLWDPDELTHHDIACLYSAEADGWTVIDDEPYDLPEIVDDHEIRYPSSSLYPKVNLDLPDPIVKTKENKDRIKYLKESPSTVDTTKSPVDFALSDLKCIREFSSHRDGISSLTFFLRDGKELPTLYFHDGGISGLLQAFKRFLYLVRDGKDSHLIRVEESPIVSKSRQKTPPRSSLTTSPQQHHQQKDIIEGLLLPIALDIGKKVRHSFRNSSTLLDKRPTEEEDPEISTITCQELDKKATKSHSMDPDASLISDFQIITDLRGRLPPRPPLRPRLPPLTREEWESYRQIDGRIVKEKEEEFCGRVFSGSIEPTLRREVWKYLLGYFKFDATDIERMEEQNKKVKQYDVMKNQWMSFLPEQETNFRRWRELKNLVEKDVIRTDRTIDMYNSLSSPHLKQLQDILNTYVFYNFDLGYVQGMSDLLSPILAVMENEADSFWCFVGLMEMVKEHFEETQENMRWRIRQLRALLNVSDPQFYQYLRDKESSNLYFAFRWLLVDYKREFEFPDLMILWEVLWTRYLSVDYSLFFALAIIDMEKQKMTHPEFDFSDIIAHINGLSKNLSVEVLLQRAESICRQIAAVSSLPEELQPLVKNPFPMPHPKTFR